MADIIDGVELKIGVRTFIVPPLNFKRVRQLRDKLVLISQVRGVPTDAQMDLIVEVCLSAIERNYPEVKKAQLEELLDLGNAAAVLRAVMGVAGLEQNAEKATASN